MLSTLGGASRARIVLSREVLAAAAVVGGLLWVYWPTVAGLMTRWATDPQYSHGYLVPLFAVYLLWARRDRLGDAALQPSWWGLPLLLVGLALGFAGTYLFLDALKAISFLPCLAGVFVLVGGRRALRWAWPGIAFMVFMVPWPHRLETALAQPLQHLATMVSTYALQTLGFAAFAEGNIIRMGDVRIGVVEACSGMSMLIIFFALSTAVALVIQRPWLDRILIFLSAIPIALAANLARITVTGVLHKTVGSEVANLVFHDLAGWLMMPLALGLLWVELRVLSWVLVEVPCREVRPISLSRGHAFGKSPRHEGRRQAKQPATTQPRVTTDQHGA